MDVDPWVLWLVLGVACLAAEIFTSGFVVAYFGVGALAASVAGALGAPVPGQLAVFAVVSLTLLVFTRSVLVDWLHGRQEPTPTNVDMLVGRGGIVTIPISNDASTGQIRVGTEFWTARLPDDERGEVPAGARVEVLAIRGVTALVRVRELPPGA